MSSTENEVRERKGKDPDFPWKNQSLEGTDRDAAREHDPEDSDLAPDDFKPWGSMRATPDTNSSAAQPRDDGPELGPDDKATRSQREEDPEL